MFSPLLFAGRTAHGSEVDAVEENGQEAELVFLSDRAVVGVIDRSIVWRVGELQDVFRVEDVDPIDAELVGGRRTVQASSDEAGLFNTNLALRPQHQPPPGRASQSRAMPAEWEQESECDPCAKPTRRIDLFTDW